MLGLEMNVQRLFGKVKLAGGVLEGCQRQVALPIKYGHRHRWNNQARLIEYRRGQQPLVLLGLQNKTSKARWLTIDAEGNKYGLQVLRFGLRGPRGINRHSNLTGPQKKPHHHQTPRSQPAPTRRAKG